MYLNEPHITIVVPDTMPMHKPKIEMIAPGAYVHDQACAVCRRYKAVYDGNRDIFRPCWACQKHGWRLKLPWWRGRTFA